MHGRPAYAVADGARGRHAEYGPCESRGRVAVADPAVLRAGGARFGIITCPVSALRTLPAVGGTGLACLAGRVAYAVTAAGTIPAIGRAGGAGLRGVTDTVTAIGAGTAIGGAAPAAFFPGTHTVPAHMAFAAIFGTACAALAPQAQPVTAVLLE